ncbi:Transcriptional regulatory protein ZraR [compost metagenome]
MQLIFITENVSICKASELVRNGLFTCLNRPVHIETILENIKLAEAHLNRMPDVPSPPKAKESALDVGRKYVAGVSDMAKEMYKQIDIVAPTPFSVIIYGETGTGKESVADRLSRSRNAAAPYITVDCGCLSKELALSELFGHEKGSFTGAISAKTGAFELADKGTLFLDEIGNLDYDVQSFLLRAIQERKIRKVGGAKEIPVNVRIIVASNENLQAAVEAGKFREDLYHRLNEFEIIIPPLRHRKEDIMIFANHFLQVTNRELQKSVMGIAGETEELFLHYEWPGNIRELKNVIRRACLLTQDGAFITKHSLPQSIRLSAIATTAAIRKTVVTAQAARGIGITEIEQALRTANFNKTKAAMILNIDRKTLYNKLKSFYSSRAPQSIIA